MPITYHHFKTHFILPHPCKVFSSCLATKLCPTLLRPRVLQPARFPCPWDFPDNTGIGCHFLLQGIFPTQGLNPSLLHHRWVLYHWNTREVPRGGNWQHASVFLREKISWTEEPCRLLWGVTKHWTWLRNWSRMQG